MSETQNTVLSQDLEFLNKLENFKKTFHQNLFLVNEEFLKLAEEYKTIAWSNRAKEELLQKATILK